MLQPKLLLNTLLHKSITIYLNMFGNTHVNTLSELSIRLVLTEHFGFLTRDLNEIWARILICAWAHIWI